MHRKDFIRLTTASAAAIVTGDVGRLGRTTADEAAAAASQSRQGGVTGAREPVFVANGRNRFAEKLVIWGAIPLEIKVASRDTGGAFFVFEHAGMGRGGPPRHFHYEQDEWFYAVKGEFAFEVGEARFTLRPGDSLFAPRLLPHAWAHVGEGPGTLLLAVQPAGTLEEFFLEGCRMTRLPTLEEADRLFAAHGMKVVGPPLPVG